MMEEMDENESVTTSSEEESDTELSYQEDSSAQSGTVHGEEDQEDSNKSQPETQEDEDMESVDHSEEEDEDTDDDLSHLKQICKRYAQRENKTKLDTCVERSLNELLAREGAVAVGPPQFSATAGKSYDRAIKKSVLPRRFVKLSMRSSIDSTLGNSFAFSLIHTAALSRGTFRLENWNQWIRNRRIKLLDLGKI